MKRSHSSVSYTGPRPNCKACGSGMVFRGEAGLFRCLGDGRHPVIPIEEVDADLKELVHGHR